MIRVIVCDDHDMVRTGLVRALQSNAGLEVVGEAAAPDELLARLDERRHANVLVLDLSLGAGGVTAGLATVEAVVRDWPALPVLVLSMHNDPELVARAMEAGARGYVTKESPLEVLLDAIHQVHGGRRYLDPNLADASAAAPRRADPDRWDRLLTPREREVLEMICAGRRLSHIAADLGLSIKTVSTHKMRLMDKLGISNNADLIKLGIRRGLG